MNCSRRSFIAASTLTACGLAIPARSALARYQPAGTAKASTDTYFDWKKLADNCHVAMGEGGNALAVLGKGETLVVDAKNCGFGDVLRREAAALGSPVKLLINTHHHADHTGGNPAFTKDITVLAHMNVAKRIASQADRSLKTAQGTIAKLKQSSKAEATQIIADIEAFLKSNPTAQNFAPTQTLPSSGNTSCGGVSIELYHVGPGHTDNDFIVHIPEFNILHGGDLLFNKVWPYHDPINSGADSAGWIKGCQKIVELCNEKTVVVPGHGDVGDVSIAKRQIEFFTQTRELAAKAIKDGQSREDFLKTPSPDAFKDYNAGLKDVTLGGLYDEAKKESGK